MYKGSKILALVPARAGSKGIKNKNIVNLNGKPLIYYSLEEANKSKYIDKIIVSTNGKEIADYSNSFGGKVEVPFMRPEHLASDTSKSIDAILHAVEFLNERNEHYDSMILLQPTQPLRTVEDIDSAIEKFYENGKKSLVSISPVNESPLLIRKVLGNDYVETLLNENSTCRRQDMPKYYRVNGAIYINKVSELNKETSLNDNKLAYIMEKEKSVDIDEYIDIVIAEYYLNQNK